MGNDCPLQQAAGGEACWAPARQERHARHTEAGTVRRLMTVHQIALGHVVHHVLFAEKEGVCYGNPGDDS